VIHEISGLKGGRDEEISDRGVRPGIDLFFGLGSG
jgi:hypothetical protein